MKIKFLYHLIIMLSAALFISGCAGSAQWTKDDFSRYAKESGSQVFEFKLFSTEVNFKFNIICPEYFDSKYGIDRFPARGVKEFMEKKYGAKIDVSEFEQLRKAGSLKVEIKENSKKEKEVIFDSRYIDKDSATVSGGGVSTWIGTEWGLITWGEYREKISAISINDKTNRAKTDQMQVYITLAPLGPAVHVRLKVRDGKPDSRGYYKMKTVAVEKLNIDFKLSGCNTGEFSDFMSNIDKLLKEQDEKRSRGR